MARKKKNENDSEETKENTTPSDFGHEVWGLIFLAIGILMLISLVSHFAHGSSNVLGYYFGYCFSLGLIWVFGVIPAFFVPLDIIYFGWIRLRGQSMKFRTLFFQVVLTAEICILLAIYHLAHIEDLATSDVIQNRLGFSIVKSLFYPIFGAHQFGPYFITGLILLITVIAILRISPQVFAVWLSGIAVAFGNWVMTAINKMRERWAEERRLSDEEAAKRRELRLAKQKEKEENEKAENEAKEKAPVKVKEKERKEKVPKEEQPVKQPTNEKNNPEDDAPLPIIEASAAAVVSAAGTAEAISESGDKAENMEDEAKRRLDNELAAFRAKKNEPIKIMTIETAEVENEDAEEDEAVAEAEVEHLPELSGRVPDESFGSENSGDTPVEELPPQKPYRIPDPSILSEPPPQNDQVDKEGIEKNSAILINTLMNFGVEGKVSFVSPGPVVTRYEIELAPGIKVSRVLSLHDDISMAVSGQRIRIEAPIPGKSAVGIELPNAERQIVHFKRILMSDAFRKSKAKLPVVIGTNVSGAPYVTDITKMPHVLIAGQTGSGKSVCINSVICSLLMTKKPEELRLIMIDPKKVELAFYERIPHLLSPVVTESKEAVKALQWSVSEMERRYRLLAKMGARNIDSFNARAETGKLKGIISDQDNKPLPFIVIIVDELADLMMTASKDVEGLIQRIAQLARAVGIHLIVATQRPSVDIITGPIKANLTSRIGFRTIQSTDSRTILGHVGAEKLLGMGDMLFLRNGAPEIERFHGSFLSEEDVEKIVEDIRCQDYKIEKIDTFLDDDDVEGGDDDEAYDSEDRDVLFEDAARIIVSIGQGSTSLLQRRMKIGYARAGRLMDELERAGFVGPPDGSKAREVLVRPDELDEYLMTHR